jgi:group I intron endonuclease
MSEVKSGIYQIANLSNGKIYVGSAVSLKGRWRVHLHDLRHEKHHSSKLQRAWKKYGESCFSFTVIEYVEDKAQLVIREQYYLDTFRSATNGYNVSKIAGSTLGVRYSEESRRKISAIAKCRVATEETRRKMSETRKGRKRGPMSQDAKEKIRQAALGRKASPETRAKMSASRRGRKLSADHAAKLAAASRAKALLPISEETRAKMSESAKLRVARSRRGGSGRFEPSTLIQAFGAERCVRFGDEVAA